MLPKGSFNQPALQLMFPTLPSLPVLTPPPSVLLRLPLPPPGRSWVLHWSVNDWGTSGCCRPSPNALEGRGAGRTASAQKKGWEGSALSVHSDIILHIEILDFQCQGQYLLKKYKCFSASCNLLLANISTLEKRFNNVSFFL